MRTDWHAYFMAIAQVVARRGTCDRRQVGCVFVRDRQILATGYNGSPSRQPHCDDAGHDMLAGHCVRTVHAEANAIAQSARRGVALDGAKLYTTTYPCWDCLKLVFSVGVRTIYYSEGYPQFDHMSRSHGLVANAGLEIVRIPSD